MSEEVEARVRAALAGGELEQATAALIRGYGPRILRYYHSVLRDADAAEDVFAGFCERLWKGLPGYRGEASLRTWSYVLAWRALRNHLVDPYRRRKQRLDSGVLSALVEEVRSTTAVHLRSEVKDRIAALRQSLTPADRTLLHLRVDQRQPWNEIAAVLSDGDATVTAAALRKRYERLKEKLRALAREAGLLGDPGGAGGR